MGEGYDRNAGHFPKVTDEAGPSNRWLPLWGGLMLLGLILYVGMAMGDHGQATEDAPSAAAAVR